jgi:endonuclease YncB( thermonuclease family)
MTLAKFSLVAAAVILLTPMQADAQGGWETIGSREVNGVLDRDTIAVRGDERFRAVRLCALGRPVRVYDADIEFANGGRQDLRASSLLSPGECSRPFNLAGTRRDITRVRLSYAKFRIFARPPRIIVQAR